MNTKASEAEVTYTNTGRMNRFNLPQMKIGWLIHDHLRTHQSRDWTLDNEIKFYSCNHWVRITMTYSGLERDGLEYPINLGRSTIELLSFLRSRRQFDWFNWSSRECVIQLNHEVHYPSFDPDEDAKIFSLDD